ncbi:hypothetical protein OF83DRAFT_1109030 [Amylostereum chailletii]|nr:hypothetical protein OF83DRAFT_1109030 [Amylostereum chailletii]
MSDKAPILKLPSEITFIILAFLSVPDVLAFRQVCKNFDFITRDRGFWLERVRLHQATLPLPINARDEASLLSLSTKHVEEIAISSLKSEYSWLSKRSSSLQLNGILEARDILHLGFLLDKLVLCVYSQGTILLWDLRRGATMGKVPLAFWELWGREPWTSAFACADVSEDAVYVAVTRAQNRSQQGSTTVLMRIPLPEHDSGDDALHPSLLDNQFNDLDTLFGGNDQIVRTLDPSRHLVAFSRSPFIDVVHWPSNTGISIDTQREELDQLWNGIIGLHFIDSHLLCVKARSLELYHITVPLPSFSSYFVPSSLGLVQTTQSTAPSPRSSTAAIRPVAMHFFSTTTFRGASFSSPSTAPPALLNTTSVCILAHDVLRGVFHYQVDVTTASEPSPGPGVPPSLRVELIGIHDMAYGIPGFVSTAALGPQSRRGVWIERMKNTTTRRVMAFSTAAGKGATDASDEVDAPAPQVEESAAQDEAGLDEDEDDEVPRMVGTPIKARTIYESSSYDLRDDLLHMAFSEVTGRIALGTRSGEIRII